MYVTKHGSGGTKVAIIGGIHGDERCGLTAVSKLRQEINTMDFSGTIYLVSANIRAANEHERYLDADLNRLINQDRRPADAHETHLAREIETLMENVDYALAIHSTLSSETPFASFSSDSLIQVIQEMGIETMVDVSGRRGSGTLPAEFENCVELEAGKQWSDQAHENAYKYSKSFLNATKMLEEITQIEQPNAVEIFKMEEAVDLPNAEFKSSNFEAVEKGEVFAVSNGEEIHAEEQFTPILMSTNGYDDKLGYKGQKVKVFTP